MGDVTQLANDELWAVFNARRVKMPELKGLDAFINKGVGWVKNRRPVLSGLKAQAERVEVRWPSGTVDRRRGVPANQVLVIREGQAKS